MQQKKKSKVEILRKKLREIETGKWRASPEEKRKLKEALVKAEVNERRQTARN